MINEIPTQLEENLSRSLGEIEHFLKTNHASAVIVNPLYHKFFGLPVFSTFCGCEGKRNGMPSPGPFSSRGKGAGSPKKLAQIHLGKNLRIYNLTGMPLWCRYSLAARMEISRKWKMEAASTASALPCTTAS